MYGAERHPVWSAVMTAHQPTCVLRIRGCRTRENSRSGHWSVDQGGLARASERCPSIWMIDRFSARKCVENVFEPMIIHSRAPWLAWRAPAPRVSPQKVRRGCGGTASESEFRNKRFIIVIAMIKGSRPIGRFQRNRR